MAQIDNSPAFRAAYLGALVSAHCPGAKPHHVALAVSKMRRATKWALGFETRRCNVPMDEKPVERYLARAERLEREIDADLAAMGAPEGTHCALGGDPRGRCGSLIIPGARGDGFGDGFAIY